MIIKFTLANQRMHMEQKIAPSLDGIYNWRERVEEFPCDKETQWKP
jgi:hypothetical protein